MMSPCKKCTKRRIGCHGTCQPYIKWKQEKYPPKPDTSFIYAYFEDSYHRERRKRQR